MNGLTLDASCCQHVPFHFYAFMLFLICFLCFIYSKQQYFNFFLFYFASSHSDCFCSFLSGAICLESLYFDSFRFNVISRYRVCLNY